MSTHVHLRPQDLEEFRRLSSDAATEGDRDDGPKYRALYEWMKSHLRGCTDDTECRAKLMNERARMVMLAEQERKHRRQN